jgi:hypothetical protein
MTAKLDNSHFHTVPRAIGRLFENKRDAFSIQWTAKCCNGRLR